MKKKDALIFLFLMLGNLLFGQNIKLVKELYGTYYSSNEIINDSTEKIVIIGDSNNIIYQIKYFTNSAPDSVWTTFYPPGEKRNEFQFKHALFVQWTHYTSEQKKYELTNPYGITYKIIDDLSSIYAGYLIDKKLEKLLRNDFKKVDHSDYSVNSNFKIQINKDLKDDIIYIIQSHKLSINFNYWYDSGNLSQIIQFVSGKEKSRIQHYYKKSVCNRKEFYKNGKHIKTQLFKNGQLKKEKTFN